MNLFTPIKKKKKREQKKVSNSELVCFVGPKLSTFLGHIKGVIKHIL